MHLEQTYDGSVSEGPVLKRLAALEVTVLGAVQTGLSVTVWMIFCSVCFVFVFTGLLHDQAVRNSDYRKTMFSIEIY